MERKEALEALLEQVEASATKWSARQVFVAFGSHQQNRFYESYHGSLDAALALHEAVLPGWRVGFITRTNIQWRVNLSVSADMRVNTKSENPARAWLVAILSALIVEVSE